jgi:hypothetical protein
MGRGAGAGAAAFGRGADLARRAGLRLATARFFGVFFRGAVFRAAALRRAGLRLFSAFLLPPRFFAFAIGPPVGSRRGL